MCASENIEFIIFVFILMLMMRTKKNKLKIFSSDHKKCRKYFDDHRTRSYRGKFLRDDSLTIFLRSS